jgi:hypothetical protein
MQQARTASLWDGGLSPQAAEPRPAASSIARHPGPARGGATGSEEDRRAREGQRAGHRLGGLAAAARASVWNRQDGVTNRLSRRAPLTAQ